jgi:predicted RNA-binding protein with PUA-like domain
MQYWIVKSEPEAYSWDQMVAAGTDAWTGVRNHLAKNHLKAMRKGDRAFFYHSNTGKEIVGVVEIARTAYPDPTAKSGDWICVDVKALGPMPTPVPLATLKADPNFADLDLVRMSRLSVSPVSAKHWTDICKLGGWTKK